MNRPHSVAWTEFLNRLREVVQLWQADPQSLYYRGPALASTPNIRLSTALGRAAVLLVSSHLQGYLESATQEFLEIVDGSGVDVAQVPTRLRAELCLRFLYLDPNATRPAKAEALHRNYHPLWSDGSPLPAGTIQTHSLTDSVWNPWPTKASDLLARADIDLFLTIKVQHGQKYFDDLVAYVDELIEKRNKIAHGDNSVITTVTDIRRYMQWSARLARSCDMALGNKLLAIVGRTWP